jgi:hypothetical protein
MSGFKQYGETRRDDFTNRHPIDSQLKVFKYPFSTATTSPKIPDGKTATSCGLKLQSRAEIVQTGPVGHILMFPGVGNGLVFHQLTPLDANAIDRNLPYKNHGVAVYQRNQLGGIFGDGARTLHREREWRIVSQQIKLTSTNGADDYDGWWECVRIPCIKRDFSLVTTHVITSLIPNVEDIREAIIGSAESQDQRLTTGMFPLESPLINNNSYCTGKIKDLHRYNFQLLPSLNDSDFMTVGSEKAPKQLITNMIDNSFDCWYMRLHGTPAVGRTDANGPILDANGVQVMNIERATTIMAHLVSNQEVIYDEASYNTRFHTECYDAFGKLDSVKKSMHQYTKAAKPMFDGGV